jgi:uncharacterized protein YaaR (DUF327 family)
MCIKNNILEFYYNIIKKFIKNIFINKFSLKNKMSYDSKRIDKYLFNLKDLLGQGSFG